MNWLGIDLYDQELEVFKNLEDYDDLIKLSNSIQTSVFSIQETVSNINVRGGTHNQNLLLWDGIKMYQSGHFFGSISAFNPYTTNQSMYPKMAQVLNMVMVFPVF